MYSCNMVLAASRTDCPFEREVLIAMFINVLSIILLYVVSPFDSTKFPFASLMKFPFASFA